MNMRTRESYKIFVSFVCAIIFVGLWLGTFKTAPISWGWLPVALVIFALSYALMSILESI